MRRYCLWLPIIYLCLASYVLLKTEMNLARAEGAWGFAAVVLNEFLTRCTPHYHRFVPIISDLAH
jgi:hypothetical protein